MKVLKHTQIMYICDQVKMCGEGYSVHYTIEQVLIT